MKLNIYEFSFKQYSLKSNIKIKAYDFYSALDKFRLLYPNNEILNVINVTLK